MNVITYIMKLLSKTKVLLGLVLMTMFFYPISNYVYVIFIRDSTNFVYSLEPSSRFPVESFKSLLLIGVLLVILQILHLLFCSLRLLLNKSLDMNFKIGFLRHVSSMSKDSLESFMNSNENDILNEEGSKAISSFVDVLLGLLQSFAFFVLVFVAIGKESYLLVIAILVISAFGNIMFISSFKQDFNEEMKQRTLYRQRQMLLDIASNEDSHNEFVYYNLFEHIDKSVGSIEQKHNSILRRRILHIMKIMTKASSIHLVSFMMILVLGGVRVYYDFEDIGYFSMMVALAFTLNNQMMSTVLSLKQITLDIEMIKKLDRKSRSSFKDRSLKENLNFESFEIEAKKLSFSYNNSSDKALNGVSFNVNQGENIFIVGINGSGKTTLSGIICGLFDNVSGQIKIGGFEYSEYKKSILNYISVIPQNFCKYNISIREYISLGTDIEVNTEMINEVLDKVDLSEKIDNLENGIDTILGELEGHNKLSKGQWQRLTISRLLINNNSRIWILDEPTAHLDPIAEVEMYSLVKKYSGDRTVFFISHRLGFSTMSDKILVFDSGYLVEEGNHNSLLQRKGIYSEMFNVQKDLYNREEST